MIDFESHRILNIAQGRGPISELRLLKESGVQLLPEVWYLADSGYQGLQLLHQRATLPVKKPKNSQLSTEQRQANGRLARLIRRIRPWIRIEHVIRSLKVFRILSDPKSPNLRYRNRRKRLALRFSLIAGIFNFELALS